MEKVEWCLFDVTRRKCETGTDLRVFDTNKAKADVCGSHRIELRRMPQDSVQGWLIGYRMLWM